LQEHAIPVAKFHRDIAESPSDEKEEYDVKSTPTEVLYLELYFIVMIYIYILMLHLINGLT
jgi:hypothetical protein